MPRAGNGPVGVRPPKRRVAPKPATSNPVFGPVVAPAVPGRREAREAQKRVGRAIASRPGVKALRPLQGKTSTQLVRDGARRLAAAGVNSPGQRAALATSRTSAGAAVRQLRAAQEAETTPAFVLSPRLRQINRDTYRADRGDTKLGFGPASFNLSKFGRTVLAHTSLGSQSAENAFARNALGDVGALGSSPFIGGYQLANIGFKTVKGDSSGAWRDTQRLVRGLAQGVSQSVPARLAVGDVAGARRSFREHPGFAALDFMGLESVAGRAAGAFARGAGEVGAGGVRGALARAGSTVRSPVALVNDAGAVGRGAYKVQRGSKSLTRQTVLRAADARREPLRDARGGVVKVKVSGKMVPVLQAHPWEVSRNLRKRGNFLSSRANAVERATRATTHDQYAAMIDARRAVRNRGGMPDRHQNLAVMVATGTVRSAQTFEADLRKRAANIEANLLKRGHADSPYRTRKEYVQAKANLKEIRAALKDPQVLASKDRIVARGLELAQVLNAGDRALVAQQVLGGREAARTPLLEYAQAHMGARHVTAVEHKALERDALKLEQSARAAFEAAPAADRQARKAEWVAAREHRIAVSGRNVDKVKLHERLQAVAKAHEDRVKPVASELHAEKARLGRLYDRRRKQVMRDRAAVARGDLTPARAASRKGKLDAEVTSAQRSVAVLKQQARDLGRQAAQARAVARKSRLPEITEGWRTHDARFLPDAAILEHAAQHGRSAADLAYLPHVIGEKGSRAFHTSFRPSSRPRRGGPARTGSLYARGATAQDANLAIQELTHKQIQLAKAGQIDKLVSEVGIRHPAVEKAARGEPLTVAEQRIVDRGGYFTPSEALDYAQRSADLGEHALIPVRAYGARLRGKEAAAIRERQSPAAMDSAHKQMFNDMRDMTTPPGSRESRNVVLMPATLVTQLEKHAASAGELERALQMLNAPFRMAVLAQPRWLTGNFIEPYIVRLPLSGAGVNVAGMFADVRAGRRLLTRMEKSPDPKVRQAAAEIRAQQFGGLFVGNRQASVRRTVADDFRNPDTGKAPMSAEAATFVRHLPVFKQMADLAIGLGQGFFHVNRVIESFAQHQAFGKAVREEIQAFSGSWLETVRLGEKSLDEVAKGLVGTPTQQRFMEAQHELLGKYEGFPPLGRRAVQTLTPFVPWAIAAARWVYWTMPVHHSATTAALLKISQNVLPQWEQDHKDLPPGALSFAVKQPDGGLIDYARYTPYGFTAPMTKGELGALPQFFAPQLQGVAAALAGNTPFARAMQVAPSPGNPRGKPNGWQKVLAAANAGVGAMVPWWAQVQRVGEHGGTPYANSLPFFPKTKPNTDHMSGFERTWNPFRETYLKPPKARKFRGPLPSPDPIDRALSGGGGSYSPEIEDAINKALGG